MHSTDVDDKVSLVTRNSLEVVTEEELRKLLEPKGLDVTLLGTKEQTKERPRAYVGYEPSGEIHLGHIMTVNKLIDLQRAGFDVVVLLADVHAYLNEKGDFEDIKQIADYNKRAFIALGLSEDKTEFVLGSSYQLEKDYVLDVHQLARITTLNRAKRSMDEVSRRTKDPMVSQMIYPLMQALDIAYLGVDLAVGGMDQRKIHMLARENLPRLGYSSPLCLHTPILQGLDGEKMSSSKGNYVSVEETEEKIAKKIKKAYCPLEVEGNPIIQVMQYHIFPRFDKVVVERDEKFGGDMEFNSLEELKSQYSSGELHPADLKNAAANYLNKLLRQPKKELST